jgi:hypothetical protein
MKSVTGSVKANVRRDGEMGEGLVVADLATRSFSTGDVIVRGRGAYRTSTWAGRRTPLAAIICKALSFILACARLRRMCMADLIEQFL